MATKEAVISAEISSGKKKKGKIKDKMKYRIILLRVLFYVHNIYKLMLHRISK